MFGKIPHPKISHCTATFQPYAALYVEVDMSNMRVQASRAFEALKSLFALIGITALGVFFILPLVRLPAPLASALPGFAPIEAAAAKPNGAARAELVVCPCAQPPVP